MRLWTIAEENIKMDENFLKNRDCPMCVILYRALQESIKIDKTEYLNFVIMKQRFLKYPFKCLQLISCNYCFRQIKLEE